MIFSFLFFIFFSHYHKLVTKPWGLTCAYHHYRFVLFIIQKIKIMKTQVISGISGCLLAILFVSSSFAQTNFITQSPVAITGANFKTSAKIQTEFDKLFTNAENVSWIALDKEFVARFSMNDQNHQALLNKKGALIYHISYGSEKNLPVDVRKLVKSTYFDYSITRTFKVEEDRRTIWVVNMEDDKKLIVVRVENGEMEEVSNLLKSL